MSLIDDISALTAVAFLDVYGRFAKRHEDVFTVRLFGPGDSPDFEELSRAQYDALETADQLLLWNAPSAAGLIDTSTMSNA